MRLLLVEDDKMLGGSLKKALEKHAYGVDWVQDGEAALTSMENLPFVAIVLDVNLPKLSGIELLKIIRGKKNNTPVLLLTARDTAVQKVEGLDSGADDYLVKPFDLDELLARLRALIRRSEGRAEPSLQCGGVILDLAGKLVCKDGVNVMMTAKEFRVLKLLMERAGKFVTKPDIEYSLYSADEAAESNTIEVSIYALRKKLGSGFIKTIRGVGYMVET
ncbi:MAG: response regulator transcription factor [Alphaproteobacteria bacterium]|nr:response regulator transcription factor [Alphaproteobacteria bacterium]